MRKRPATHECRCAAGCSCRATRTRGSARRSRAPRTSSSSTSRTRSARRRSARRSRAASRRTTSPRIPSTARAATCASTGWPRRSRRSTCRSRSTAARPVSCCRSARARPTSSDWWRCSTRRAAVRCGSSRSSPRRRAACSASADFRDPLPRVAGLMWGAEDLSADLQGTTNRDVATGEYLGALPHRARRVPARRTRDRHVGDRRGVPRLPRPRRARPRKPRASRARLRREDRDPSGAARGDRRRVLADGGRPAWAERVVAAFGSDAAVAQLDGVMLDVPHLRRARAILGLQR